MNIKRIKPKDYHDIFTLQNESHPTFLRESMVVLTSKVFVSPDTCFSIKDNEGFWGYILAIPYPYGKTPPLDMEVDRNDETETLFIHDCVVNRYRRGRGIAEKLTGAVEQRAREKGFKRITLVAVEGSYSYWQRLGFTVSAVQAPSEYGEDAVFMEKEL